MSNATPSEQLAASLATFSKSAYQLFAEIESNARSEVARAVADTCEARNERDKAMNALHERQLEGQSRKQELLSCSAALKQAEVTIAHQTETITQLRREATQWKDQSRNWQEHFTRVEQERCVLSTRIDELIAERHQWSRSGVPGPFTPTQQFTDGLDLALSSTTTKRASTSSSNQPPSYRSIRPGTPLERNLPSDTKSISAQKPLRTITKSTKAPKNKPQPSGDLPPYEPAADLKIPKQQSLSVEVPKKTRQEPRQTVIRRVHAVVHVKREDSDDGSISTGSNEQPLMVKVKTKPLKKRKVLPTDEYTSGEEDDDRGGECVQGSVSDEDDELMLGAEENHQEVYGTHRVGPNKNSVAEPLSSTKKRKLDTATKTTRPSARRKN